MKFFIVVLFLFSSVVLAQDSNQSEIPNPAESPQMCLAKCDKESDSCMASVKDNVADYKKCENKYDVCLDSCNS